MKFQVAKAGPPRSANLPHKINWNLFSWHLRPLEKKILRFISRFAVDISLSLLACDWVAQKRLWESGTWPNQSSAIDQHSLSRLWCSIKIQLYPYIADLLMFVLFSVLSFWSPCFASAHRSPRRREHPPPMRSHRNSEASGGVEEEGRFRHSTRILAEWVSSNPL